VAAFIASVDDQWLVPHFEKMLYDNALLGSVYLRRARLCRRPLPQIAERTIDQCARARARGRWVRLRQDADTDGVEG
jgi:uncharacterized protein YyaL (SSP411 family)